MRSWIIIIIVVTGGGGVVVASAPLALSTYCFWCLKRQKSKQAMQEDGLNPMFSKDQTDRDEPVNSDLPVMPLRTILQINSNFSDEHKLVKGGFGPVYKGVLLDERQVAIKRLSKTSGHGLEVFKYEIRLTAKLQHRNLVRLLACCIDQNDKLLICISVHAQFQP